MTDLHTLLERVEAASGHVPELDAKILCAVGAPHGAFAECDAGNYEWYIYELAPDGRKRLCEAIPYRLRRGNFTASLDATVALVEAKLPGCELEITAVRGGGARIWGAGFSDENLDQYWEGKSGAGKPPLFVLSALLRAMIAEKEKDDV